jgi:adenine C2-methylase RlmN of 23S rRNA A2503 and tRNA A37
MKWTVLPSQEDSSVTFVLPSEEGNIETRYVRRNDEYFIVYLSSHACQSNNKQIYFEPVTIDMYLEQALRVFSHYDGIVDEQRAVKRVFFNWMAMGDVLSNPHFINDGSTLLGCLKCIARERGLSSKFNVSTILPIELKHGLVAPFKGLPIDFYYSLYSMNETFRKRWIPNGTPVKQSLQMLSEWQKSENREVVLHWAFIKGENDSEVDVNAVCDAVEAHGLKVRINLVRYNPPNDKSSESCAETIEKNLGIIQYRLSDKSKIVPLVGKDIFASCGQFFVGD